MIVVFILMASAFFFLSLKSSYDVRDDIYELKREITEFKRKLNK